LKLDEAFVAMKLILIGNTEAPSSDGEMRDWTRSDWQDGKEINARA